LRFLKRAWARSAYFALPLAERYGRLAVSVPIALLFYDIFLEAGRWQDAYIVSRQECLHEIRPALQAELFLAAAANGYRLTGETLLPDLITAARQAQLPELTILAALEAMTKGQGALATLLLTETATSDVVVGSELLWDTGSYTQLVLSGYALDDYDAHLLQAAASQLLGEQDAALQILSNLPGQPVNSQFPPYIVALLLADNYQRRVRESGLIITTPAPHTDSLFQLVSEHEILIRAWHETTRRLYSEMRQVFPTNKTILAHYLKWLLSTGQYAEYSASLHELDDEPAAAFWYRLGWLRLTERRETLVPFVIDTCASLGINQVDTTAVLATLIDLEAWEAYRHLFARVDDRGDWRERPLFTAYNLAFDGLSERALEEFQHCAAFYSGMEIPFNTAMLLLLQKEYLASKDMFIVAAGQTVALEQKSLAYLWAARCMLASGYIQDARDLAELALSLDPQSGQANLFMVRFERP